jgi:hypothetical protein
MADTFKGEALEALCDPSISLQAYAKIIDQRSGKEYTFNPFAITHRLQETVLSYYSNPPRTGIDQAKWLTLLGYRQGGKSLTAELCGYVKSAYTPGHDHVCIADNKDRAEYLHRRIHLTHSRWPEPVRARDGAESRGPPVDVPARWENACSVR